MKIYLELIEKITDTGSKFDGKPEIYQIEVADEVAALAKLPVERKRFGKNFAVERIHYCYHEEGLACKVVPVKKEKTEKLRKNLTRF